MIYYKVSSLRPVVQTVQLTVDQFEARTGREHAREICSLFPVPLGPWRLELNRSSAPIINIGIRPVHW